MNGLKDLRIKGLKDLKINGLKYLRINELKHLIHKSGDRGDTEIGDLEKSKKEVETKIRKLFSEKKEIESRIVQLQKIDEESEESKESEESEEIPEFPWIEEIFPPLRKNMHPERSRLLEVETDALQKEDAEISERIDSQIGKKVEITDKSLESKETGKIESDNITEIKVKKEEKSVSEKNDVKSNEVADLSNIRKKAGEIAFPENADKIKTADPALEKNEKDDDRTPEKSKTESKKPDPGIFGGSLIEELLESEDLYPEEEQSFMKYIGESSVTDLIKDLKDVKKLLA
jgi:hypothetical protein